MSVAGDMELDKRPRIKYCLDRSGAWAQVAVIFMLLSAIARMLGVWGLWEDSSYRYGQIMLPMAASLIFVLFIFMFAQRGFFLSIVPVFMGVAFFVIQALSYDSLWRMVSAIVVYVLLGLVYAGTVLGMIRSKWLLPPLLAAVFVYDILVIDLPRFTGAAAPWTFHSFLQELSVVCVLVSLFCVSMGLKKRQPKQEKTIEAEPVEPLSADTRETEPGAGAESGHGEGENK